MKEKNNKLYLDKIISNVVAKKCIYGAVFCVSSKNGSTDLISASGNIKDDKQYYIASINKYFVSAIILQ